MVDRPIIFEVTIKANSDRDALNALTGRGLGPGFGGVRNAGVQAKCLLVSATWSELIAWFAEDYFYPPPYRVASCLSFTPWTKQTQDVLWHARSSQDAESDTGRQPTLRMADKRSD